MDIVELEAWLKSAIDAHGPDAYVRVRSRAGVLGSWPVDSGRCSEVAAILVTYLGRGARVELLKKGGTNPLITVALDGEGPLAAPGDAALGSAVLGMAQLLVRVVERTTRANEELLRSVVSAHTAAAEVEGYALGRQASPELRDAVTAGIGALTDRLAGAPVDLLRRAAQDPAQVRTLLEALSPQERAGLVAAVVAALEPPTAS